MLRLEDRERLGATLRRAGIRMSVLAGLVGLAARGGADTAATEAQPTPKPKKVLVARVIPPVEGKPTLPTTAPKPEQEAAPEAGPRNGFSFGMDYYMGVTNVTGVRMRNNDGVWGGANTGNPSFVALNWRNGENRALHLSWGIGDMFNSAEASMRQPLEAYYQVPLRGGNSLTVGKFLAPFATQEWVYQSNPGVAFQGTRGGLNYVAALHYNDAFRSANAYLRLGRQFGERTSLGLSAAFGRGLFATSHNAAFGLDFSHDLGAATLDMEYNFARGPAGAFHFGDARLTFTKMGRWEPFLGIFSWRDVAEETGNFRSGAAGLRYHLTSYLTLEGAFARTGNGNVYWLQSYLHF